MVLLILVKKIVMVISHHFLLHGELAKKDL